MPATVHAKRRTVERWRGMKLTAGRIASMIDDIQNARSRLLERYTHTKSVHAVKAGRQWIPVVYQSGKIITVLPPTALCRLAPDLYWQNLGRNVVQL